MISGNVCFRAGGASADSLAGTVCTRACPFGSASHVTPASPIGQGGPLLAELSGVLAELLEGQGLELVERRWGMELGSLAMRPQTAQEPALSRGRRS